MLFNSGLFVFLMSFFVFAYLLGNGIEVAEMDVCFAILVGIEGR